MPETTTTQDWFKPCGSAAADDFDVVAIRPGDPGWNHTGLFVTDLADGESRTISTGDCEYIVLPLSGAARVEVETAGERKQFELAGRADVFSGPSDLVYVPRDAQVTVTSVGGGRYAWPFATANRAFPVVKVEASAVPVELRGAGQASRQVQNFGTPGTLEADSIIACEVITPAGNWSSYPPHKHDEERPGVESNLEEIYYFEMRAEPASLALRTSESEGAAPRPLETETPGNAGPDAVGGQSGGVAPRPFGYQRVYGTDERPIDVLAEVRSGDTVLVPHGWHGPAMAPTGYDMYYLNVMAGPGEERVWLICDDPAHTWVRDAWPHQDVDPRLPIHEHN